MLLGLICFTILPIIYIYLQTATKTNILYTQYVNSIQVHLPLTGLEILWKI